MIQFSDITWAAGAFVLEKVNFSVPAGIYAVLMGRTGSGKTTLLEILCGLRQPDDGRIWIGGRDVTNLRPGLRGGTHRDAGPSLGHDPQCAEAQRHHEQPDIGLEQRAPIRHEHREHHDGLDAEDERRREAEGGGIVQLQCIVRTEHHAHARGLEEEASGGGERGDAASAHCSR